MMRARLAVKECMEHMAKTENAPHTGECPAFLALSLIANKWSIRILHSLLTAPTRTLRFGQLQKTLGVITQRELTKHLREFEKSGLIARTVHAQIPPRVDYTLTELGQSLWEPIQSLSDWADRHATTIQATRQAFADRA